MFDIHSQSGAAQPESAPAPSRFPLVRLNFIIMAVAGLMIVLGFILMTGSSSTPEEFNPDIFSTRRIVIGPLFSFLGYVLMGVGIIWPARRSKIDDSARSAAASPIR